MKPELFEQEKKYQAAMSVAKSMLDNGVITSEDYQKIQTIFREKYGPVFDTFLAVEPSFN